MHRLSLPRGWLALLLSATPVIAMAQTQPQFSCPMNWEPMGDLRPVRIDDLDKQVYGVKVRDWKPEYLDQALKRYDQCQSVKPGPQSLKDAEHNFAAERVVGFKKFFIERDRLLALEKTGSQIGTTVQQSDLRQLVTVDSKGFPQSITVIYGPTGRAVKTCSTLRDGIGYATAQSYGQVVQFARLCQQAGSTDAGTVSMLERQAAAVPALYKAMDEFAAAVKRVGSSTKVADGILKQLEAQRDSLLDQLKSLKLPANDVDFVSASTTLDELRQRIEQAGCGEQAVKAGFPSSWKANLILLEWNSPESFCRLVQLAGSKGAKIRYLSGGVLGKDGFEVKSSKRTVQIFTQAQRIPGGDPSVQMMVPVAAKIDGQSLEVTRNNLPAVVAELAAAARND